MSITVLLDIKKAFDIIDHNILLQKLNHESLLGSKFGAKNFFDPFLTIEHSVAM